MSLLSVALLLLTTSLHTMGWCDGDIVCLPGKSHGAQVVHIGSNHSLGYKTHHGAPGETYRRNTMCEVHFKKSSSCPSLVFSCPKFDIAHPKANCKGKGGDFLAIGKKRFCQNKGPTNFTSTTGKLTVSFNANKKVEGEGAECTIACSDHELISSGATDVTAVFEVRNGLSGGVLDGAFIQFDFDSQYSGRTDSNGVLNFTLSPNGPFNLPTSVSTTLFSFVPNTSNKTFKASPSVQHFSVNLVPE